MGMFCSKYTGNLVFFLHAWSYKITRNYFYGFNYYSMGELFSNSWFNWMLIVAAAFILGMAKAGIKGIDMLNVTLMAIVFGGKTSTGIVLPLLCAADIMAVTYYHRHAQWYHFWRLIPYIVIGILIGVWVGKDLDEALFKKLMAVIISLTVAIMIWLEWRKNLPVPHSRAFSVTMGLSAGFTTMLGNLAGAFSNLYFLANRLPKNNFIGTAAWLFLVINFFKLPFQIFYWHNISASSLQIDLYLLPALAAGFLAGVWLVAKIKDDYYRRFVFVLTLVGAVFIFVR